MTFSEVKMLHILLLDIYLSNFSFNYNSLINKIFKDV